MAPLRKPNPQVAGGSAPLIEFEVQTAHGRIAGVESLGLGTPLVFLHGNSASRDIFQRQLASPLAELHRLVAIDLPGHGRSSDAPDPDASYTVPGYADAVVAVLEARGIDAAAFIGWSLGGHIALELLATYPEALGVFLVGTPPLRQASTALREAFTPTEVASLLGKKNLSEAEVLQLAKAAVGAELASFAAGAINRTDGRARLRLIESLLAGNYVDEALLVATCDVPVAVVLGERDPFVCREYVERLSYRSLWGETCHIIPETGHAAFIGSSIFDLLLSAFAGDMERRATDRLENPLLCFGG